MEPATYIVLLIAALCSGAAALYYIATKVVRDQLEKTLPVQINSMKQLLGGQSFRLILDVKNDGTVDIKDFRPLDKSDYIG